jgi:EmrB/QacA subfamily drug resistance transporter
MYPAMNVNVKNNYILIIISIALANFMAGFDATIVTIALPTIATDFNLSLSSVSWIITAYVLIMAACVLIFGKLSDYIGYKKMFLYGFSIFTIASFTCGFLPVFINFFPVLIISRIIQAIGAVMITAIGPAMVTAFIPMEMKGKAMGTIFTFAFLAMTIAPIIGGILTQYLSWSWIFYINIPVGFVAILLGIKAIPTKETKKWAPGFDIAGSVLICIGLSSLLYALSEGQTQGWTDPVILAFFIAAIIALGCFVWCEFKVSDPLLEFRLFRQSNFLLINMALCLELFVYIGLTYLSPFYLQYVQRYSPAMTGLIFTALSIGMVTGGILGGTLYNKIGGRMINIGAAISVVIGYFLTLFLISTSPGWYMALCLFLVGTGVGSMVTTLSNMAMNSVSKKYQGMISSFICLERFAPITIGIAIFNIVFIQGMNAQSLTGEIGKQPLASIDIGILLHGYSLAFLCGFFCSVFLFVIVMFARQEIHPDYQSKRGDTQAE